MIEEQFVSFDTAKLLQELGFDVPCRGGYHVNRFRYEAPTQALAAMWLREIHHYAVCVWLSKEHDKWFYAYGDIENMVFDEEYSISEFIYDSYEEALEAGLQEAIKLIKKQ